MNENKTRRNCQTKLALTFEEYLVLPSLRLFSKSDDDDNDDDDDDDDDDGEDDYELFLWNG